MRFDVGNKNTSDEDHNYACSGDYQVVFIDICVTQHLQQNFNLISPFFIKEKLKIKMFVNKFN